MEKILLHNSMNEQYKQEINFFADLEENEFQNQFLGSDFGEDKKIMAEKFQLQNQKPSLQSI